MSPPRVIYNAAAVAGLCRAAAGRHAEAAGAQHRLHHQHSVSAVLGRVEQLTRCWPLQDRTLAALQDGPGDPDAAARHGPGPLPGGEKRLLFNFKN